MKGVCVMKLIDDENLNEHFEDDVLSYDFENYNDGIIRDSNGNRWVKCKYCGKLAMEKEFVIYGGKGTINIGTCYDCQSFDKCPIPVVTNKRSFNPGICPECGSPLINKMGKFGLFIGCSNYPICKFTRKC